jgi:hypothetical protein
VVSVTFTIFFKGLSFGTTFGLKRCAPYIIYRTIILKGVFVSIAGTT